MKHVIVHIGPHKTGSTAIQQCLLANQSTLDQAGILFLHDNRSHQAAMLLAQESFEQAEQQLQALAATISVTRADRVILSQEDFCGELPGRSRRKLVYPKLTKNLRIISRSLHPHRVTFVFFLRDEDEWLASCYYQHLKHRTFFSKLEDFQGHFSDDMSWSRKLKRPKELGNVDFIVLPYSKGLGVGVAALLEVAGEPTISLAHLPERQNVAPSPEKIRLLERINALSEFRSTAWFAKSLVLSDWTPKLPTCSSEGSFTCSPKLAEASLPDLARRAFGRTSAQVVDDILPDLDVDLEDYIFDILPGDVELPTISRIDIRDQSKILDYHMRGKSRLAKLNALTISYLRRETDHTAKAKHLFHRVWSEHGPLLINELSTRWLISTLQTFLDHGRNEAQRMIGASGYFYANMMKIYEGERSIEGRSQDTIYDESTPQTANKFAGLDRYNVGGTDLLLNTNALALDLSMRDDVAGLVLQELLLRVKSSHNVFTRMDRTRKDKGIEISGFEDTWSFFVPLK